MDVARSERGWGGHFIGAASCLFRRNTLLSCNGVEIVVSTVGLMQNPKNDGFMAIGAHERYYETMAFHSDKGERYRDADVSKEIFFNSEWAINMIDADDKANEMHEMVCNEITVNLASGETYPQEDK